MPGLKALFLALGVLCLACGPVAAVLAQDAAPRLSRNLDRKLRRDAARITLRLSDREDLRFQSIRIPNNEMARVYEALKTMHAADEGVRSIFRCNVHTRPNPSIDHMMIIFDRDIEWAEPLREGRHETTSIMLNDLLYEHDLIIEKHITWDESRDAISIRSKNPLNMAALANEFNNIVGVGEIRLSDNKEIGNDITAIRVASGYRFTFTLSFGSLSQKGEKTHVWQYECTDAGAVTKVSEEGEPVPEWMRCSTGGVRVAAR